MKQNYSSLKPCDYHYSIAIKIKERKLIDNAMIKSTRYLCTILVSLYEVAT